MKRLRFLLLSPFLFSFLSAQEGVATHTSSLGMKFKKVDGLPIHFAEFETRVADFNTYVQERNLTAKEKLHFEQTGDHPVVNVTKKEAAAFADWLTGRERAAGHIRLTQRYRLPFSSEWSKAAGLGGGEEGAAGAAEKAKDERAYPWGTAWPPPKGAGNFASDDIPNYSDPYTHTAPAGKFEANKFGLHDLAGNVWEWTEDDGKDRKVAEDEGVLRGGSWVYFRPEALLAAHEYRVEGELVSPTIGFRLVFEDDKVSEAYYQGQESGADARIADRVNELTGEDGVSSEELAAMRERLLGKETAALDPANLPVRVSAGVARPAAGRAFQNMIGMEFVPLGRNLLVSVHETRVREMEYFRKQVSAPDSLKPNFEQKRDHPAVNLSLEEAEAFCVWLTGFEREKGLLTGGGSYRLPSDTEWTALMGLVAESGATPADRHLKTPNSYPWGNAFPPSEGIGNFNGERLRVEDADRYTASVGSYKVSPSGLHDLAGNVAEWVSDPWGEGVFRTARGSSWLDGDSGRLNSSFRHRLEAKKPYNYVGFRVVLELP